MSQRRTTIADVAREAGVSPSTASVVFSGKTPVSEATKERVRAAAVRLEYGGPDPRAASLRTGRSGVVAVVFDGHLGGVFLDPVTRLMMDGLAEELAPRNAGLLLLREDGAGDHRGLTLTSAPIDAAVLIGCHPGTQQSLQTLHSRGVPVVVIEGDAGPEVPRVILDNVEAQRTVAAHVRALGHTDVAIVTLATDARRERGPISAARESTVAIDVTRDRLAGARAVYPHAPAYSVPANSIDEGLSVGRMLFVNRPRPTAVIAQSDLIAAGVIRAAEEAGMHVPEDVSVTGFDGIAVDGMSDYRLTTMLQPATEKGRAAGRAVAAMLDGRDAATFCFTSVFLEGNTTAGVPASNRG